MAYFYFFFIQNFLEKISLFPYVNVLAYFIEWSQAGIAAANAVASLLEQKGIQCPCCASCHFHHSGQKPERHSLREEGLFWLLISEMWVQHGREGVIIPEDQFAGRAPRKQRKDLQNGPELQDYTLSDLPPPA